MWNFLVKFSYCLSACALVLLLLLYAHSASAAGAPSMGCLVRSGSVVMVRPCPKVTASPVRSAVPVAGVSPRAGTGRRLFESGVTAAARASKSGVFSK